MKSYSHRSIQTVIACAFLIGVASAASAESSSEHAAALLIYPYVAVDLAAGSDTVLQLSNAGDSDISVRCFYENAPRSCSNNPSLTCVDNSDCTGGTCDQGRITSDFVVTLGPGQPFGWHASNGGAVQGSGSGAAPPVADPFIGTLRCVAVDTLNELPAAGLLEGVATIVRHSGAGDDLDLAKYNAVGFGFIASNGDNTLLLGGPEPEYEGCAFTWILQHSLDGALDPIDGSAIDPSFILVPCGADFMLETVQRIVVHLDVYNELAQRLGTSTILNVHRSDPLIRIHPTIFSSAFHGTLTAQTRIRSVGGGIIALSLEQRDRGSEFSPSSIRDPIAQGAREAPDVMVLP